METEYDIGVMEYFFNGLHGQIVQRKIMSSLKTSSVESYLRAGWSIPSEVNFVDAIPQDVREWYNEFIHPLENKLVTLSDDDRKAFIVKAKKELCKILGWGDDCRGYC